MDKRYVYIGPDDERGDVPTFGFDEGVVHPDRLRQMVASGHVRRIDAPEAPVPVEPVVAPRPEAGEELTKATETPVRRASARPTRPAPAPAKRARR